MNGLAMYTNLHVAGEDEIVRKHASLVKRVAYHLISRLPASVQPDDLIQAGMIGLLEAAKNYDPNQGASFETYAGIRIRGSMLDEIRKGDWAPRSVHRNTRRVAEVIREIENTQGRDARDNEVADRLEVTVEKYHQMLKDATGCKILSYEDLGVTEDAIADSLANHDPGPQEDLLKESFQKSLAKAISTLPERERLVMALYYDEEFNLREIGEVLGVSESRVSQIHSKALVRLKARLRDWREEEI
jgi:RNA polymerase sigma factor FliA